MVLCFISDFMKVGCHFIDVFFVDVGVGVGDCRRLGILYIILHIFAILLLCIAIQMAYDCGYCYYIIYIYESVVWTMDSNINIMP